MSHEFQKRLSKWSTYKVLMFLRKRHRLNTIGHTADEISLATGVSVTHVANMYKRGYLVRLNRNRHPNEKFLYGLTYKYTPKRWDI